MCSLCGGQWLLFDWWLISVLSRTVSTWVQTLSASSATCLLVPHEVAPCFSVSSANQRPEYLVKHIFSADIFLCDPSITEFEQHSFIIYDSLMFSGSRSFKTPSLLIVHLALKLCQERKLALWHHCPLHIPPCCLNMVMLWITSAQFDSQLCSVLIRDDDGTDVIWSQIAPPSSQVDGNDLGRNHCY